MDGKLDFFHWQGKLREYWSVRRGAPVERASGGTSDTVDGSHSPGPESSPLPFESEDPSGPDLTVLIATYRRPEILRRTLEAYRRMDSGSIRWMLVLVDNAGDVRTEGLAREFALELPLEYLVESRRGKNFALNAGLRRARGGLLVFSDDDTVPEPDWLAEIWFGALRWPEATMFTGRILPIWPPGYEPLELRTDLLRSAYMVTAWGEDEGYIQPERMWGPNLAIRAVPFREGLRFDTSIGPTAGQYAMGSELELAVRLSRNGHKGVYLPRAIVRHQIRPEQMEESWLAGRAFRSGRGVARLQGLPSSPSVLGMPRFVFREVGAHAFEWLAGLVAREGHRRLDGKLGFFHWLGKLRGYRRLWGRRAHEPSP